MRHGDNIKRGVNPLSAINPAINLAIHPSVRASIRLAINLSINSFAVLDTHSAVRSIIHEKIKGLELGYFLNDQLKEYLG